MNHPAMPVNDYINQHETVRDNLSTTPEVDEALYQIELSKAFYIEIDKILNTINSAGLSLKFKDSLRQSILEHCPDINSGQIKECLYESTVSEVSINRNEPVNYPNLNHKEEFQKSLIPKDNKYIDNLQKGYYGDYKSKNNEKLKQPIPIDTGHGDADKEYFSKSKIDLLNKEKQLELYKTSNELELNYVKSKIEKYNQYEKELEEKMEKEKNLLKFEMQEFVIDKDKLANTLKEIADLKNKSISKKKVSKKSSEKKTVKSNKKK